MSMPQVLGSVGILREAPPEEINQIFAPGETWADSSGLIYDVEEP